MNKKFKKRITSLLFTLLLSINAGADSTVKPYIAAEVGAAYWDIDFLDDDVGLSFTVGLGLRIGRTFALEGAYQNFGTMNFVADDVEGELEAESASLSVRYTLPLEKNIKPFIYAGAEKMEYTEQSDGDNDIFNRDENTETTFGFGLSISQDERSDIRVTLASHANGDIIRLTAGGALDF